MSPLRNSIAALSLALACVVSAYAQGQPSQAQAERTTVVASAAAERVRFAAPNRVARLRLEVLSPSGDVLFEANSRGSVLDWTLADSYGNRLADGRYLCVVTLKDVAGHMTQRLALVEVANGVAAVRDATAADLTPRQAEAVGPVEQGGAAEAGGNSEVGAGEAPAAALLAHDGREGQLVTTAGDLSFRGGDFFTGRDRELMRLSQDGSLEVTGALVARGGIRFADGTTLESAGAPGRGAAGGKNAKAGAAAGGGDGVTPAATTGRLAKFADSAGSLVDSAVAESGGRVGFGTDSPQTALQVNQPVGAAAGKGIFLSGDEAFVSGNGTPGVGVMLLLGVNRPGNRQLWVGDREALGRSDRGFFRIQSGVISSMDAVSGDGLTRLPLNLGTPTSNVGVGFNDFLTEVPGSKLSVSGGLAVGFGYKAVLGPANGAIVEGSLGVGTISPQSKLHVIGDIRLGGQGSGIIFPDGTKQTSAATGVGGGVSGAGTAGTIPLWTGASTLGNSAITQADGNVGIGTSAPPAAKLEVAGNVRQSRDRGGWVKAMIYVNGMTGAITRCFNSFAADGGASQAGCGFTVSKAGTGLYTVGFPFAVSDRFYSLATQDAGTTEQTRMNTGANFEFDVSPNALIISTYLTSGPSTQTADASFMLVVY